MYSINIYIAKLQHNCSGQVSAKLKMQAHQAVTILYFRTIFIEFSA